MKEVQEEIIKTENDLQFEGDLQALRSQGDIDNLIIFNTCKTNDYNWTMKFKRKWLNTTVKYLQGALLLNKKYSRAGIKKISRDNCMEITYNKLIDLMLTDIDISYDDFKKLCLIEQEKEYIGQTDITYNKHGKKIIFNNVSLNDTTEDGAKQYVIEQAIYKNWNNDTIEGQETNEYRFTKDLLENPNDILQKNANKQKQIIKMLSEGYTQKEITQDLKCSEANISQQIRKIRNKFYKKYGKRKDYKIKSMVELKQEVDNLLNKTRTRRFKNTDKLKEEIINLIEEFNDLEEFNLTEKDIYKLFKNTTLEKTQTNIINIITNDNEREKGKLLNSLNNKINLDLIRYTVVLEEISKNLNLYINKYQNSTKIG